jgi:error-prone DNA polymerase
LPILQTPNVREGCLPLLGLGNLCAEKGSRELYKKDVFEYFKDIIFIAIESDSFSENFDFQVNFYADLQTYKEELRENLYLAINRNTFG